MFRQVVILMVAAVLGFWPSQPFGAVADRLVGANAPNGGALLIKRFPVTVGTTITGAVFLSNDLRTVFPKVALLSGSGTRLSDMQVLAQALGVQSSGSHWVSVSFPPVRIMKQESVYLAVALPPATGELSERSGAAIGGVKLDIPRDSYFASELDDDVFGPMDVEYVMELVTSAPSKAQASEPGGGGPATESSARMLWTAGPRSSVVLDFDLPRQSPARLTIYDMRGRLVSRLLDETLPAGMHRHVWEGSDDNGRTAPAGVYVARLVTDHEVISRKVVLTR